MRAGRSVTGLRHWRRTNALAVNEGVSDGNEGLLMQKRTICE